MPYDRIVEYYDDIFPLKPATLAFLQASFCAGGRVLDVGCGSGEYVLGLARAGYAVSGLDLDAQMIERAAAKAHAAALTPALTVGSMTELPKYYAPGSFDGLFCIGNSLVHAGGHDELAAICRDFYSLLDHDGRLVIQVINYDRVLQQQLTGLPTIENSARKLRFERYYEINGKNVLFTAVLKVDGIEERTVNRLYAVRADELRQCLQDAGFRDVVCFGDFVGGPFAIATSQPLIVRCQK
jgi:SAM-dependent methyltransferase